MKKIVMAVVGVALAVALTGCKKSSTEEKKGDETASIGSPKGVAEDFAKAVIQRDLDDAVKYVDTSETVTKKEYYMLERLAKDGINDDKLEAEAIDERVRVPAAGYMLINGRKYTGERAEVKLQFKKGKDKKSNGMEVELVMVDGSWKVSSYKLVSGLSTSDGDDDDEKLVRKASSWAGEKKADAKKVEYKKGDYKVDYK